MKPKFRSTCLSPSLFTICLGMSVAGIHSVQAATEIQYANPAAVLGTAVSSTAASDTITVDTGTGASYAVGDIIRFTGNAATTNPFGTAATNFYIVSVSGDTITVATTPGGTTVAAINTTTASTTQLSQSISNPANWTGGDAPDTNSESALFTSPTGSVPEFITTADQTLYGIRQNGSGSDLNLASGANGTGYFTLTFATDDSTTPKITGESSSRVISLGSSAANTAQLVIAGTQGLIFNSRTPGTATGTGTNATSGGPPKNTRLYNVDWTGLTGDLVVERGEIATSNGAGTFPNHNLTVGNAQTITNNILAGLVLGTGTTLQTLNGNSLGRIYGNNTLFVGNNDAAGGDFGGVIGRNFPGQTNGTNVTKIGFGDQTISGVMGGTGTLNANQGILNLTGTVEDAAILLATGGWLNIDGIVGGTGQINANSGLVSLNSANTYTSQTVINNGGTLAIGDSGALGGALAPSTVLDITTTDTSTAATVAPGSYLVVGTSVTGFGITVNTVVTAYNRATGAVTLNNAAAGPGTVSATFDGIQMTTTTGVADVSVAIGTPIVPGMYLTGAGIDPDTLVNSYNSVTGIVTLNKNATADGVAIGTFAGSTDINGGGTFDLNGQTTAERIIDVGGVIINDDTVNPAELTSEMVNLGNPTFDGPGDITVNNIFRTNGVTRRTTKNGAGTLTLAGDVSNSRYGLTVNDGDVILAKTSGEAISRFALIMNNASSTVTLINKGDQISDSNDQPHEINAGTLDLNGFDEGLPAIKTSTGVEPGGIITNSDGGTTSQLTLFPASPATWPGTISGNLDVYVFGTATQTLTGPLSYTGFTRVQNEGELELAGAATLLDDNSDVILNDNGTLNLSNGATDIVDTLTIDGVQQAPGLYGSSASSAPLANQDDVHFAGTGVLSVTTGPASSDYDTWAAIYAPADLSNMAGDNDNDGLDNKTEYAYGLSPVSGSSVNPYISSNLSGGSFTYQRRKTTGLTYTIETSTDLVVWSPDLTAGQVATDIPATDNESVVVTPTGPLPPTKVFVRVKAD